MSSNEDNALLERTLLLDMTCTSPDGISAHSQIRENPDGRGLSMAVALVGDNVDLQALREAVYSLIANDDLWAEAGKRVPAKLEELKSSLQ